MKALGRWSVVSLIRFIVQFVWAMVLVILVMSSAMMLVGLFTGHGFLSTGFPVYLQGADYIQNLREVVEPNSVVMQSVTGFNANYFSFEGISMLSVLLSLTQVGLLAFALYGLTILKRPLNALVDEKVFEPENSADLKTVSLLLLLAAPLKFGYEWLSKWNFESINGTSELSTMMPPFDFTLLIAGLICYVISEIVNQATILHEEQKLTV